MNIANNMDFKGLQILNVAMQVLATAPAGPKVGQFYFDSAMLTARQWDGTAWQVLDARKNAAGSIPIAALSTDPLARANHTGFQTASTISDLASVVKGYKLNEFAAPTANVAFGGFTITGYGSAGSDTDVPSWGQVKAYADNLKAGLDVKDSVRVATTGNIALTGTQAIDGVTVAVGNRVLVKNQTNPVENGIYLVAAGAWARSADAVTGTLTPEAFVFAEEGTSNATTSWRVTNSGAITTGTTSITWAQFGAGTTYTAGNGINIAGNAITAVAAPSGGVTVSASGIALDTTIAARKWVSAAFGDGSASAFALTHNLNTSRPAVTIWEVATNTEWIVDKVATNANTVTVTFGFVPTAGQFQAVVVG